jgi:hypothetical protein
MRTAMSEKLFRFLLSEMTTVRICCCQTSCAGVIEMPVEKLYETITDFKCPVCGNAFTNKAQQKQLGPLESLGHAVRLTKEAINNGLFEVEFVLPDSDSSSKRSA